MTQTLTTQQVAARLQLHPITVQRWLRNGTLRGVKLPGKAGYRVPVSEVERLEQGQPAPQRRAATTASPDQRADLLVANLLHQAERARERGDDEGAARFEMMAAEAARGSVE
jgi:excisionase family DNA binding protein